MFNIIVAEYSGFCFGVERAVNTIENYLTEHEHLWTIGMPIHNPEEVMRLQKMGLLVADSHKDIPDNSSVLIRAHGEASCVFDDLKKRNINIIDMTCPFVKKAQNYASKYADSGYQVVLLGNKNHPEIIGISGHVKSNAIVVADEVQAREISYFNKIALITQTTQEKSVLSKVCDVLLDKCSELLICNTICKATSERQNAVKKLVAYKNLDGIVLIGGKLSSNTAKLAHIIESQNVELLWIENPEELDESWLKGKNMIGIAAGASTPSWLITDIKNAIINIKKNLA